MANRARYANLMNHNRQMDFLRKGVVMLPKKKKEKTKNKKNH